MTGGVMSSAVEESYVVKLANGARSMTVEELDAALDAGIITPSTQVLAPGAMNWSTLGELAGIDEEEICTPPIFVAPPAFAQGYVTPPPGFASLQPSSLAPIVPPTPPSLAPMAFAPTSSIVLPDSADELGFAGRRRAVKIVGLVFGAAAAIAVVFGIQSAISQSIASSAAQAALAAQPPTPATPPPAPSPLPPPVLPPVVAKVPPPPTAAPAAPASSPASASAKTKDADKNKRKLPGSPSPKKKK